MPDLPLFGIRTLDEHLAQARWPFRVFGTMFAIFALIALTLSAVGLYAVTAYAVSQRTQEIGIRMALGAQGNEVSWLFLRRSFVQLAIGLTLGVAGAFGVGQLFASTQLLVQNTGRDPITIGGIAIAARGSGGGGQRVAGETRHAIGSADRAAARLTACTRRRQSGDVRHREAQSLEVLSGGTPGIGRGNPDA